MTPTAEDLTQARQVRERFPQCHSQPMCLVSVREQELLLLQDDHILQHYAISTSRFGVGSEQDSQKTPPGAHRIAECIGADQPIHTVFKGRVAQDRLATIESAPKSTGQDCITTRILWLEGLEDGLNRGGPLDSYRRYIYIHGTHEEGLIGQAASVGCIRLRAQDMIDLFEHVQVNTLVLILP